MHRDAVRSLLHYLSRQSSVLAFVLLKFKNCNCAFKSAINFSILENYAVFSISQSRRRCHFRRIYTTFILGTALLNFGPRADSFGHGPLDFLRVNANFSARVPKNLGGPRPPLEVVPARFLGVPCPNFSNFARPYG